MVDRSTWTADDWFIWGLFGRDASYRDQVLAEGVHNEFGKRFNYYRTEGERDEFETNFDCFVP